MDEGWVELSQAKKDFSNLESTTDGFFKKSI